MTIGDSEWFSENEIKNAAVANVTHALDKEIVAGLYLKFPHANKMLTIHDAFGTHLGNMDQLFKAIRDVHAELYQGDTLLDILEQNTETKQEAKEIHDRLFVGDWDPNAIKKNQQAYGKAGKADKKKLVENLYDRGAKAKARQDAAETGAAPDSRTEEGETEGTGTVVNTKTGSAAELNSDGTAFVQYIAPIGADVETTYIQTGADLISSAATSVVKISHLNKSASRIDDHISAAKDVKVAADTLASLLRQAPTSQQAFNQMEAYLNGPFAEAIEAARGFSAAGYKNTLEAVNIQAQNAYLFLLEGEFDSKPADVETEILDILNNATPAPIPGTEKTIDQRKEYPNLADEDINDNICK